MSTPPPPPKVDRQTTTPFLLRLFYKQNAFHSPSDFDPTRRLPQNLQIYTWHSCTLRELSSLLLTTLPTLLPRPHAGTRIAFRLVYGDMNGPQRPGAPARLLSRDLGSVVVGARTGREDNDEDEGGEQAGAEGQTDVSEALSQLDGDPEKSLGDAKFVIGDYVSCAILPPLADGSVQDAPPPPPMGPARGGPPRDTYGGRGGGGGGGGGGRDYGNGGGGRDYVNGGGGRDYTNGYGGRDYANGYGGRGGHDGFGRGGGGGGRGSRGGGGRFDERRDFGGVPSGEWRRGEAPPEREWEREGQRDAGFGWRGGREGGRARGRGGRW